MEKLNTEKFIEKAKLVHGDKYDYSLVNYVDCTTPVKIICPIHGEFEQKPPKHTSSKHGCPKCDVPVECKCLICGKTFLTLPTRILQGYGCNKCNKSKGEMLITNIFDSYNILYESQKCINFNDRKFYIDFCVNNTFIEYNGRQHYMAIDYFGGDASYQKQVERDVLLRNYCKEHDITLIEIPYTADNRDKILNYLTPILNEYNINL